MILKRPRSHSFEANLTLFGTTVTSHVNISVTPQAVMHQECGDVWPWDKIERFSNTDDQLINTDIGA